MRIEINPPARRSLTPNEKAVYEHLKNGLTPQEICRKMHIRMGTGWADNLHDVPFETLKRLVCSIREKGWEIPGENINRKENKTMSATITQEKIEEIRQLRGEGMSVQEIEKKTGISHGTIYKYIKKEPETAATVQAREVDSTTIENTSTPIIAEAQKEVKAEAPKIIITKPKPPKPWNQCPVVHITPEAFEAVEMVSAETGRSLSYIASQFIVQAYKLVEIREEE